MAPIQGPQSSVRLVLNLKPHTDFYRAVRLSCKDTAAPGPTIFLATNSQIDRSRTGIGRTGSGDRARIPSMPTAWPCGHAFAP